MNRELPLPVAIAVLLLVYAVMHAGPPGPKPDDPTVAPIKVDKLVVAVIEESQQRGKLTGEQLAALTSPELRATIKQAGGEFRLIDKDDPTDLAPQWVKDALAVPRTSLPWLIVATPSGGFSGELPKTLAEVQAEVAKHVK